MVNIVELERARQELQARLDAGKSSAERNRLGQFATPIRLAAEIIDTAVSLLSPLPKIRFLDPAFGTGAFYSALLSAADPAQIETALGFEIDRHYGEPARIAWQETGLELRLMDFTRAKLRDAEAEKFNLVICNPPYVRHHHLTLEQKRQLQADVSRSAGIDLNGLTGLYCYFMVLSQAWMAKNGIGAWLVPSEFMDVNYGTKLKKFLLENVTLLHIHRFDPDEVQFDDALVSSAVVIFRNAPPQAGNRVHFSFGGTLLEPKHKEAISAETCSKIAKWTSLPHLGPKPARKLRGTLADLFTIKRGLATGCNEFFVLSSERIAELNLPRQFLRPILPSPKALAADVIEAEENGNPKIAHPLFLLDCSLSEEEIRMKHPTLWSYLQSGVKAGISDRYLCQHREPWYSQENRQAAPFICTYMGRPTKKSAVPFRFILNHSNATAANVYLLLYPKSVFAPLFEANPELRAAVWKALSSIKASMLTAEGRLYGGGLHKLEPKELANVPADAVLDCIAGVAEITRQGDLFRDEKEDSHRSQ